MDEKYWALVDLRYPASEAEYKKAVTQKDDGSWPVADEDYDQVVVKTGGPLVKVCDSVIKSYLGHGRSVIETDAKHKKRLEKDKKAKEATS